MRQLHSVRARLTLWNVAGLALTLLALGTVLHFTLQTRLLALVDWDLADRAHFTARRWTHRRPDGFGPPGGPRRDFDFHNSPPPRPRPDDRPRPALHALGTAESPAGRTGAPARMPHPAPPARSTRRVVRSSPAAPTRPGTRPPSRGPLSPAGNGSRQ